MMRLRLANFEYLIDINDLHDELGYVRAERAGDPVGALTRHRELLESDELAEAFPIFRDAERVIADPVVRNRGTIGGSLCQADPSEDLSAVCTTLDASCVVQGARGQARRDDEGLLPRSVRDRRRRRRDARRDPPAACGPTDRAPTRRSERRAGDWAVVSSGAAVWLDGDVIADARVGLAAVGPNTTGHPRDLGGSAGTRALQRGVRPGRRYCRPQLQPGERHARQRRVQAPSGGRADPAGRCGGAGGPRTGRGGLEVQVSMTVNGREITEEIEGRMLLVHFLRDQLGLTGTHWGCDTSNCGTCVVWFDDEPVKSCTVLAAMAGGHEVRTVEGLEHDGQLDPVQQGFMACHGLQCGFCTPGMLMTARALVGPEP